MWLPQNLCTGRGLPLVRPCQQRHRISAFTTDCYSYSSRPYDTRHRPASQPTLTVAPSSHHPPSCATLLLTLTRLLLRPATASLGPNFCQLLQLLRFLHLATSSSPPPVHYFHSLSVHVSSFTGARHSLFANAHRKTITAPPKRQPLKSIKLSFLPLTTPHTTPILISNTRHGKRRQQGTRPHTTAPTKHSVHIHLYVNYKP